MAEQTDFAGAFAALKGVLQQFESSLVVVSDEPDNYYANTRHIQKNKQPLFFGAVQIKKAYVSLHLMPVYLWPELLADLSSQLKARMQGKACFNFKRVDADLFEELAQLTRACFEKYRANGFV